MDTKKLAEKLCADIKREALRERIEAFLTREARGETRPKEAVALLHEVRRMLAAARTVRAGLVEADGRVAMKPGEVDT